ncbi:MAG: DUF488 domain-containing protein [Jatrophihabitans sp.]|nr:MAG: DUF488 domain-containing protein [Jatrophihabitans sp.]
MTVYSLGHSTRDFDQFLAMLTANGIEELVDIRSLPGSRRYPWFDREALAASLPAAGIGYRHAPALGGRRRGSAASVNTGWHHPAFRAYADYMQTPQFATALEELIRSADARQLAIMCSEAVPWRCHRRLVTDALLARGVPVLDLIGRRPRPATMTPFAVAGPTITYPEPHG